MKLENIKEILGLYRVEYNNIIEENIEYEIEREAHVWNINDEYILKSTESEEEIKNSAYISKLLLKYEIPCQKVVETINNEDYIKIDNNYYILFTRIKGNVLNNYYEGDYVKRGEYLGECIAKLHKGLKSITNELKENKSLYDNDMIKELNSWVNDAINKYIPKCKLDKNKIDVLNEVRKSIKNNFEYLYYRLPRQVIHRDIHGENMIFQGNELVGYLDFDLSQINARIFDICYLCTGALAKVFNNLDLREKWSSFAKAVIRGYDSECHITEEEKKSIKFMMFAIELIMIAFFIDNGYEELADINIEIINWINAI